MWLTELRATRCVYVTSEWPSSVSSHIQTQKSNGGMSIPPFNGAFHPTFQHLKPQPFIILFFWFPVFLKCHVYSRRAMDSPVLSKWYDWVSNLTKVPHAKMLLALCQGTEKRIRQCSVSRTRGNADWAKNEFLLPRWVSRTAEQFLAALHSL